MVQFSRTRPTGCVGALVLAAIACSEAPAPTTQPPVNPRAGKYLVKLSGKVFGHRTQGDQSPAQAICLNESDSAVFAHKLAENYYRLHAACTVSRRPRDGDRVTGVIICPADPKLARGANRFDYNGVMTADGVTVSIKIKLEAPLKEGALTKAQEAQIRIAAAAMERATVVIEAKRVGDCR